MVMRPNLKHEVIAAAIDLADESGISGVTLDAAAKRAGLTKGGVIYHFPTKQALLLALSDHLVERWEAAMITELGRPVQEASAAERIRTYVKIVADPGDRFTRADIAVATEAWFSPDLMQPWITRLAPWFALGDELPRAERARLEAVRLATDGLWIAEATRIHTPDPEGRKALIEHLLAETGEGATR